MKQSGRPRRAPSHLSDALHHQLNMYALAASAAGVGMLALAQPAEAKIVYTHANKVVPNCNYHPNKCFKLDLNNDKVIDFTIPWVGYGHSSNLLVLPGAKQQKNKIWGTISTARCSFKTCNKYPVASALSSGVTVGANSVKFQPDHNAMFEGRCESYCTQWGQWQYAQNKYLGLMFRVKGKVHYGWARLSSRNTGGWKLTGYAYETIANRPIITGKTKGPDVITVQPASLGHLALGAVSRNKPATAH